MSESLILLKSNGRCERIAQVAQQKWATMSDSLRPLRGNERSWANRSGRLPKMSEWVNRSFFWANRSFAHFWAKKRAIVRKTDDRISSPACPVYCDGFMENFFFNKINLIFLVKLFEKPNYVLFLQNRFWKGLNDLFEVPMTVFTVKGIPVVYLKLSQLL